MSSAGLTSGSDFLRDAACRYFWSLYGGPRMYVDSPLSPNLLWTPALRFTLHGHINVFVEPSESDCFPKIIELKQAEVRSFPQPIAIYAVCPDDVISAAAERSKIRTLKSNGFGLITVDPEGRVTNLSSAIPLVQVIAKAEVDQQIGSLPNSIKQRVSEAFEHYRNAPINGIKHISELVEGLVKQAGADASRRKNVRIGANLSIAKILDIMHQEPTLNSVRAEIGGVRGYVQAYRNPSHHWPKNKAEAYTKYADCRHGFLDGIRKIVSFREAMKKVNLSGNLPRT